jgi:hypothetical protein
MTITPTLRHAMSPVARKEGGTWVPTPDLIAFADLLGWKHNRTFASIVKAGQDAMLRGADGEPLKISGIAEEADAQYDEETKLRGRDMLDRRFGQTGNASTFLRSHKRYKYLIYLSNWGLDAMRRAEMMALLLKEGLRFGQIILVGSLHEGKPEKSIARLKRDDAFKGYPIAPSAFDHLPNSELASMRWFVDNLVPPIHIGNTKIIEVAVERIAVANGPSKSGNTRSSLQDWRKAYRFGESGSEHQAGDVLAITNGWQTPRGQVIVEHEIRSWPGFKDCVINTIGAGPGFDHPFAVRVKEFNAYLYEVNAVLTAAT